MNIPAGKPERFAGPGETVAFRAGEPHRFRNAGNDEPFSTAYVEPADYAEHLPTQLFESTKRKGAAPRSIRCGLPADAVPQGIRDYGDLATGSDRAGPSPRRHWELAGEVRPFCRRGSLVAVG
jgi:hypothetical protein